MATKADFTDDEWDALHRGATGSAMLVSVSDRGFTDTFKESSAIAKHLAATRSASPSPLIRELAGVRGTGFGVTTPPAEIETRTLAALTSSVATLQAKAPDDLDPYRAFVIDLAVAVGAAAKGGDEAEAATVAKIRAALGA